MIKTKLGEKAIKHPQIFNHLLDTGHMQKWHGTPVRDFAAGLRFSVACWLAAVPFKNKYGFRAAQGEECNGYDEFMKEHHDEIEEVVRDIVNATYGQEGLDTLV
jgi:hypothetical protein